MCEKTLVERLKEEAERFHTAESGLMFEAAARIEELETQLELSAHYVDALATLLKGVERRTLRLEESDK